MFTIHNGQIIQQERTKLCCWKHLRLVFYHADNLVKAFQVVVSLFIGDHRELRGLGVQWETILSADYQWLLVNM